MRKFSLLAIALLSLTACQSAKETPIVQKTMQVVKADKSMKNKVFVSNYDFATTVTKIQQGVSQKGMTVFATIDHQEAGKKAGLDMQPATVIIFGTPKAGTPLMKKDPHFALELPLKVLVTKQNGKVEVVMNDTHSLIDGSKIDYAEVENSLAKAVVLIENLVK